jgi:hypothetical protein
MQGCLGCENMKFADMMLICDENNETIKEAICQNKFNDTTIRYNFDLKAQIIKYFWKNSYMVNNELNKKFKFMNQMDLLWDDIFYFNSDFLDMEGFVIVKDNDVIVFDILNHLEPEHMMCNQVYINWTLKSVEHEVHDRLVENSFVTENHKLDRNEVLEKCLEGFKYY